MDYLEEGIFIWNIGLKQYNTKEIDKTRKLKTLPSWDS